MSRSVLGAALALVAAGCHSAPRNPDAPPPAVSVYNLIASAGPSIAAPPESSFAHLVESLSEPGGYFDSDNIITNEMSYLKVLDILRAHDIHGGAYVGVGPDQNFSYIAATRPSIAFVIDIRRDNLLEHLLFKALFAAS